MVDCTHFLERHGDFRDGLLEGERHAAMERHLTECGSCARYDRTIDEGILLMQRLPAVEPSLDFTARLQRRISVLEVEEEVRAGRSSEVSLPLAVAIAVAIGASAWIPANRPAPELSMLPPVTAHAPYRVEAFRGVFSATPPNVSPLALPTSSAQRLEVAPAAFETVRSLEASLPLEDLTPPSLEWGQITSDLFFQYSPMATYISYKPGGREQ